MHNATGWRLIARDLTTLGDLGAKPIDHTVPVGPSTYVRRYAASRPRRTLRARVGAAGLVALTAAVVQWEGRKAK